MATYSNIGIKLITTGDESGTWGDTTNTNFSDILDEAIAGAVTYNIASDADATLTVSDGSSSDGRHAVIKFTSTTLTATRTITFAPDTLQKTWLVINSTTGGQSLTFKQGSAGATVTVPNGESAIIYSDGAGATNGAITKALDSFTNTKITTGTLNATTLDLTNLEVTNVKAKDGTAALTIADSTGKVTVSSELAVDNLNLSGNAITSTDTNGNIDLTPNGTGEVNITKVDIDAGTIDGTTIGASSASTGAFTTLSASSTVTLSGGTANGVLYLDGSKVATSGSALVFDGTNLGVGTNAPTKKIDARVNTAGEAALVLISNDNTAGTSGSPTVASLEFASLGVAKASIAAAVYGNDWLSFRTGSNAEQMRLTTTGLGIGTSSPGVKLDVAGEIRSIVSGGTPAVYLNNGSTQHSIQNNSGAFTFYNSGVERMRLDSSGNLGIGTTSPGQKLDIIGSGRATGAFAVGDSSGNFSGSISNENDTSKSVTFAADPANAGANSFMRFNVDGTERARIDAAGNFGLGVTPSASTLPQFEGSSNLLLIGRGNTYISNNATFNSSFKYIVNGAAGQYNISGTEHRWYTAASGTAGGTISFTQAMTLDASGRLLISAGASAPNDASGFWLTNQTGVGPTISGLNVTFQTGSTGAQTERARITSGGLFGVGTTSPNAEIAAYTSEGGTRISATHGTGGSYPKASGISFGSTATSYSTSNNGGTVTFTGGCGIFGNNTAQSNNPTDMVFWTTAGGSPAERARLDSAGNFGLGVTPSAWGTATFKGLQVGANNSASLAGRADNTSDMFLGCNVYWGNGDFRYIASGTASYYRQNTGAHVWYSATSGSADGTLSGSETMTLDASGRLGIGTSSPGQKLEVAGNILINTSGNPYAEIKTSGAGNNPYLKLTADTNNWIVQGTFSNTNDELMFQYNSSTLMTLDKDGNLGVGTSSPAYRLDVAGPAGSPVTLNLTSANSNCDITMAASGSSAVRIRNNVNDLQFHTNGTERARITAGGFFKSSNSGSYDDPTGNRHEFVSSENATGVLRVTHSTVSNPFGLAIKYSGAAPNGTSNEFLSCTDTGGIRAEIRSNGGLANYSANDVNLSDERVKTDIVPLGSMWDKFKAIKIVTFKYKDQTHDDDNIGVIAQQVEAVAPEFVDVDGFGETPDDGVPLKSVYTADLYHAAIKALQEAMTRIEALEAEVAALKGAN